MAAPADSHPLEWKRFLPTCEATLNHRVVGVLDFGSCDFLCFLGIAGFDFYRVAFAVESDYFYREVFEYLSLRLELSPEAWRQAVQTEITKEKSGNARLFCNATGIYSEVYASIY